MKIFKAFFGIGPKSIKKRVIISPIIYPKQFEKKIGKEAKHFKSILSYLVANFGDITFIKTPMTQSAVYDLVVLLKETLCEEVVFIGAIGGLAKGLKIGDLVEIERAKDIYSVSSIHEETKKKMTALKKEGVVGIDFEAESFFKAAKQIKLLAKAYFVVTDLPLSKPFYHAKTENEKQRIKSAVEQVIDYVK
jgi:purine-nucleoside phosphorylase